MSTPAPASPPQNITIQTDLDDAPLHAAQIGRICVSWANLEWNMYHFFEILSGSPAAVARAIFYSIESNRGKRDLLLRAGSVLLSSADQNTLDYILGRVAKCASQRNKYVHDTWCVAQTQKHEVFQLRLSTTGDSQVMEEATIPDMVNVVEQIKKLTEELFALRERVVPTLQASLEKYRALPGIGLQFRPKGHPLGKNSKGRRGRP